MLSFTSLYLRFRWLHVPGALLVFLLQRTPLLRTAVSTEYVLSSSMGAVLKGTFSVLAAMGAVQTVAGATAIDPAPGTTGNPAQGTVGAPFTGGFAVVGAPATAASYQITGTIPAGLTVSGLVGDTVNASVVTVTGTPTQAGTTDLTIRAWNSPNKTGLGGSPSFTYSIVIAPAAGAAPTITTQPVSLTVDAGANVSFTVAATGDPAPTFQWRKDGANLSGATGATLSLTNVTTAAAGAYTVVATNASGSVTSNPANLVVNAISTELAITQHPVSANVSAGSTATFTVAATGGNGTRTIQWFKEGSGEATAIPGATSATLTLNNVQNAAMGFYFARVTSGTQQVDSNIAILTTAGGSSRLSNLSTRGFIAAGGDLTPGFVLSGDGDKELLIRSVGPTLGQFVEGAIADPRLELIPLSGSTPVETSDSWGSETNAAAIRTATARVGAFALLEGSADAALLKPLPLPNQINTRGFSVRMRNQVANQGGLAIAEVYDTDLNTSQRLVNVSARGFSGVGIQALVPGFVIDGTAAKTMLIRVVGPTLGGFGVPDTMVDPRLRVVPTGKTIGVASNDNWGGTTALKTVFATVGAFPLGNDASLDAALVVRLPPGGYTVVVEGANGGVGTVLVEAYEVD